MFGKRDVAALVAEFLGTGILTLLILSVQRSTIGVPFFVAAAAGLTVVLLMLVFGEASGGQFNPALTIGAWTVRKISTIKAILYVAVQLLGAWAAYYLYTYFVNSKLQPIGGHYSTRILVAEAAGAVILGFAWAAATYRRFLTGLAAAAVGLGLMLGIIAASTAAIGIVNPAVALGVKAWVWGTYVLGPIIGAVIGINLYAYLFGDANPKATFAGVTSLASGGATTTTAASTKKPAAKKKPASKKK